MRVDACVYMYMYVYIDMQDSELHINALLCGFCWSFLPALLSLKQKVFKNRVLIFGEI